jgi:simple sugar transport system permease protein
MLYSSLLAFSAVNLKADQTIGGTALNLLATALAVVVAKRINGTDSPKISYNVNANQVLNNLHFSFNVGPLTLNWFIVVAILALVGSWFVLYRTRFGMRLMACGEHPQAADSVGINVYKMRWAGVLISGALGGIGGMAYIVPAVGDWNFENGVAGMGFLALAVMIFGQWKPLNIAGAALFFAIFRAMANIFDSIPFLAVLGWPKEIYNMMPFIASMIILAFTSKKSRAPKAEGIPYDKGSR